MFRISRNFSRGFLTISIFYCALFRQSYHLSGGKSRQKSWKFNMSDVRKIWKESVNDKISVGKSQFDLAIDSLKF